MWGEGIIQMDERISPEERLFKVIQQTKEPVAENLNHKNTSSLNLRGFKQVIESFISRFKHSSQIREPMAAASIILPVKLQDIDFKKVNVFLCVILASLILLTAYYALKRPNLSKVTGAVFEGGYQAKSPKPIDTFKPLTFYAQQTRKRDIFHPVTSGIKGIAGSNLQALTKDLGLAGIYQPLGGPSEAMIEDKTAKKTYFLKEGDEIKGMKVKAILKDRVILRYGEEEMELL
jgi:hypothetical protein